ncbi:MAG: S8 family peptidase [Sphingobacteriaceae bacterium]|nr:MAG: S8 family peptidase [Sphingobacteriaceae bacterium]
MKNTMFKSFNRNALVLATLSMATLASCSKEELSQDISSDAPKQEMPSTAGKITGEYMVVLKDGQTVDMHGGGLSVGKQLDMVRDAANQLLSDNGIGNIELGAENMMEGGFTTKLSPDQIASLKNDARVAYIEQDRLVNPAMADGDIKSTNIGTTQQTSWGTTKVGGAGDGTGKTAWIIDSGIDPNHSDLNVDKTRSKSFLTSTQAGNTTSYADEFGHGTSVAGIIGAKNNAFGTVGVAAGANLVSLRVMDANGSAYVSKIVAALNWVAYYGKPGDVVNLSIGFGASTTVDDAVKKVAAKGIYVAIAAGNSSADAANSSPARVNATNVFTVSAMNSLGVFTSPSNYGATTVDYAAPGVNVVTTAKGGGYAIFNGTSSAAPHMAGILLLTAGKPKSSGYVTGDKDSKADAMASK